MRQSDAQKHPEALKRERQQNIRFISGLVVAACGLVAVFVFKEVYFGFTVALVGTGIVPIDKLGEFWRR